METTRPKLTAGGRFVVVRDGHPKRGQCGTVTELHAGGSIADVHFDDGSNETLFAGAISALGTRRRIVSRLRVDTVDTPGEFAAVAHLRGWLHDGDTCPICAAYRRGHDAAIREIAEGK